MRNWYPFYGPLLAVLLWFGATSVAAQTAPQGWKPQPWRQYLVKLEVERDTVFTLSDMLGHPKSQPKVDLSRFSVGTFSVPDSPSIFTGQERWIGREGRRKGHVLGNFIEGMVNTLFL